MDKFYYEKPSLKRKDEIIEFLDEFKKYNSNINGSGWMNKIYSGLPYLIYFIKNKVILPF